MTGVEVGLIILGAGSLAVSLFIASSIGLTVPDRVTTFSNHISHKTRKKFWDYYTHIDTSASQVAFYGVARLISALLSDNCDNGELLVECTTKGRLYITPTISGQLTNFTLPVHDNDVAIKNKSGDKLLIRVQGSERNVYGFTVYYDSKEFYEKIIVNGAVKTMANGEPLTISSCENRNDDDIATFTAAKNDTHDDEIDMLLE